MRIPIALAAAAATALITWPITSTADASPNGAAHAQLAPEPHRQLAAERQGATPAAPDHSGKKVIQLGVVTTRPAAAKQPTPRSAAGQRAHTGWPALDQAIEQLPYYYPGVATWHVGDRGGWGVTYFNTGDIFIAPRTPADRLLSVVMHEYAHALTGRVYGGYEGVVTSADRHFQQPGVISFEVEADCMALVEGATWTWYSSCPNSHWRADALQLLQGRRLS